MARLACFVLAIFIGVALGTAEAAGPRVLPEGKQPADVRLAEPKDLNGYFPFAVAKSKEEWEKRAKVVKRQIAVSQGIWPEPEKTPLNAVVHGKMDRGRGGEDQAERVAMRSAEEGEEIGEGHAKTSHESNRAGQC